MSDDNSELEKRRPFRWRNVSKNMKCVSKLLDTESQASLITKLSENEMAHYRTAYVIICDADERCENVEMIKYK